MSGRWEEERLFFVEQNNARYKREGTREKADEILCQEEVV